MGESSARVRASVSACVCVEMQNGHGTPQREVYRGPLSHLFSLLLSFFFFFLLHRGGSTLLDDSFNFLGRAHLALSLSLSPFPPMLSIFLSLFVIPTTLADCVLFFSVFEWKLERLEQNGEKAGATRRAARARADFYELSTLSFSSVPVFLNPRSG